MRRFVWCLAAAGGLMSLFGCSGRDQESSAGGVTESSAFESAATAPNAPPRTGKYQLSSSVRAVTVALDRDHYLMRSPMNGCAGRVFAAIGIKPPPLAEPIPAARTLKA